MFYCDKVSSVVDASQKPSSDWKEFLAADGRRYYYNKRTKHSSWQKPLDLVTPLESADASIVWKEYTSAEGKKYYYNKDTKQSKWTIPELAHELVDKEAFRVIQSPVTKTPFALDQASASASSINEVSSSPAAVTHRFPAGHAPSNLGSESTSITVPLIPAAGASTTSSPMGKIENSSSHGVLKASDGFSVQDTEEAKKGMAVAGKVNTTPVEEKAMDDEPFLYASKQARKEEKESRKEKEHKEKEKDREKRDREKDKGKDRSKKDDSDSKNLDSITEHKEDKKRDRKHRKRHQDDVGSDKDERDESKRSRRHGRNRKKSRKKHKRDSRSKNGAAHEELEDGEVGEDGGIQLDAILLVRHRLVFFMKL